MGMKKINKLLKKHRYICFLDFEGSQFSHEMIAYGAVLAYLDKNGNIKRCKRPIKYLVKCKNKVGRYVEKLTGITSEELDKVGIPFSKAMKELKKYCGLAFNRMSFMTFGNHDMRILSQSVSYNLDAPTEITKVIQKNYIDFQNIISEFIKDNNNNPYSLTNYLKVFGIKFDGIEHDPRDDAMNLMLLYKAFMNDKDILLKEYLKTLGKLNHIPDPAKEALRKLSNGESVTGEEFKALAKEYIND